MDFKIKDSMMMVLWPRSFHNLKVLILIKDYPFVGQMELIKIVLVVVAVQDLQVHRMPIEIVYLNGNLSKNICMKFP
jgi:hypothetical protein